MITKARLDEIAGRLREKPPVPAPEKMHTKREAVQLLKPVIMSLKKKGYSLQQISDFLRDEQIDLTANTLKTYLQANLGNRRTSSKPTVKKAREVRSDTSQVANSDPQSNASGAFAVKLDIEDL